MRGGFSFPLAIYEGEKEFYIRRGKKKGKLLTEVKFLFPPLTSRPASVKSR
jgi:hypothetical protein